MSEEKAWAERLRHEVDAFLSLWHQRRWLAIVFLLCLCGVAVYFVSAWFGRGKTIAELERNNATLQAETREQKRDIRQLESENKGLRETVAPLLARAAREFPGEEINESLKKVVAKLDDMDPVRKLLTTISIDIQVRTQSDKPVNGHDMGFGAYLAFGKGNNSLLTVTSRDSYARQTASNEVTYQAICTFTDGEQLALGKPISELSETEYLQFVFAWIPKASRILGGSVKCTFNGTVFANCVVPPQMMTGEAIFVRDMKSFRETLTTRGK